MRHTPTEDERLREIADWFARHRHDSCPVDCPHGVLPPQVWSEYFAFLLEVVRRRGSEGP